MGGRSGRIVNKRGVWKPVDSVPDTQSALKQMFKANVTVAGKTSLTELEIGLIAHEVGLTGNATVTFTGKKTLGTAGEAYTTGGTLEDIGGGVYLTKGGKGHVIMHDAYDMRGNKVNQKNTLAHELTHLKQLEDGRLQHAYKFKKERGVTKAVLDSIYWEGKKYISATDLNELIKAAGTSKAALAKYKALPWEKEAYDAGDAFD